MRTRAPYPAINGTEPCTTGDPERFFPYGGPPVDAEALCRGCHVLDQCREFAIDAVAVGQPINGVWGGTTAIARHRIRADRRRARDAAA